MTPLREVAQQALEALEISTRFVYADNRPLCDDAIAALRAALAQEHAEPVAWLSRDDARLALWRAINERKFGNPTDDKLILEHLRQNGLWIGKYAAQQALEAMEYHVEQTRPIHRTSEAIIALRAALAQEPQTTHSEECWRWHHACAVAEVERLRARGEK